MILWDKLGKEGKNLKFLLQSVEDSWATHQETIASEEMLPKLQGLRNQCLEGKTSEKADGLPWNMNAAIYASVSQTPGLKQRFV